jgi:hypothetical protein
MDKHVLTSLGIISVMSLSQVNPEALNHVVAGLSILQLLRLLITGSVLIDWMKFEGWKEKMPFYLIKCENHGYQLSYPSGFNKLLICPKCIKEKYNQLK